MDDAATKTSPFAPQEPDAAADVPAPAEAGSAAADAPAPADKPVPLRIAEAALTQVLSILRAEDDPDSLALRVAVTGVRGVEYAYDLSFEEQVAAEDDDLIYNQGDLVVMIPADSVDPLWGATLDLPSAEGQGGLVIRNPNRPVPLSGFGIELTGAGTERINQLFDQQISPARASHGGFARLDDVVAGSDGSPASKAVVTMGGGCQGCAVSAMTLRDGIQKAILEHIPEITEVVDATDHAAGENPYYVDE